MRTLVTRMARSRPVRRRVAGNQRKMYAVPVSARHTLKASVRTVHRGIFDAGLPPVLAVESGDIVEVTSLSGNSEDLPGLSSGFNVLPEHQEMCIRDSSRLGGHHRRRSPGSPRLARRADEPLWPDGLPARCPAKTGDPPFFFGARDGFGVLVLDFGQLQLGPVGKIEFPRYNNQYSRLMAWARCRGHCS